MSKYGVFSGPSFLAFGLITEIYGKISIFSPNAGIYGPGKTPYLHTFYAVDHKMEGQCFGRIPHNARNNQRRCSLKKDFLKNFEKLTGKQLHQSLFFNKVSGWSPANLSKKKFSTVVFLWNL